MFLIHILNMQMLKFLKPNLVKISDSIMFITLVSTFQESMSGSHTSLWLNKGPTREKKILNSAFGQGTSNLTFLSVYCLCEHVTKLFFI